MKYSLLFASIVTLSMLQACAPRPGDADRKTAMSITRSSAMQTPAPHAEAVANMMYSGIYDDSVTLEHGRWQAAPFVAGGASRPAVGLVNDFILSGDLDGDGTDEAVVFLWENSGGSGTRLYIAAAGVRDGENVNLGTALVGDRVQLRSGRIENGLIELDVVQHAAGDPACCPSQRAQRYWKLDTAGLREGSPKIGGTLSTNSLADEKWQAANSAIYQPL